MTIALMAHDKKKNEMIELAIKYKEILKEHELYATGTTGTLVMRETGLSITRMKSGPLGGRSADRLHDRGGAVRPGAVFARSAYRDRRPRRPALIRLAKILRLGVDETPFTIYKKGYQLFVGILFCKQNLAFNPRTAWRR